jgi:hypothetical protein
MDTQEHVISEGGASDPGPEHEDDPSATLASALNPMQIQVLGIVVRSTSDFVPLTSRVAQDLLRDFLF